MNGLPIETQYHGTATSHNKYVDNGRKSYHLKTTRNTVADMGLEIALKRLEILVPKEETAAIAPSDGQ